LKGEGGFGEVNRHGCPYFLNELIVFAKMRQGGSQVVFIPGIDYN